MNALIRKEVRLQLPVWAAALVVVLLPAVVSPISENPNRVLLLGAGPLLAFIAALGTFGREFGSGTFSSLLALPVARARLWWAKVGVLAVVLASVYAAWWLSFWICARRWPILQQAASDGELTPLSTALFVLVIFSGGLWTTLVFRQVAAALWFALLLPLALTTSVAALAERFTGDAGTVATTLAIIALAYSAGGFLLAWRLFLQAEDAHWTGGAITLPALPIFARRASATKQRVRRPLHALLRKELHLHHPMLLVALLLLVLHLASVGLRQFAPNLARQPVFETVLNAYWGLWLLMPALICATAVAEERKLGLMESQLCQPIGWRRQWLIKFLVALTLGIAFGTVPPNLLEATGNLPNAFGQGFGQPNPLSLLQSTGSWLTLGLITFGIGLVSFHASTLARNTLQALGIAAVSAFVGAFLFKGLERPEFLAGTALWQGNLGLVIGYPAISLALLVLAARNFRHVNVGRHPWTRNLAVLAATFLATVTATAAIYHRAWEWFQDSDPVHGPARLGRGEQVSLQNDGQLSATVGDELIVFPRQYRSLSKSTWNHALVSELWSRHSLGTNWMSEVSSYFETVAIRPDGTLWASEMPRAFMTRSTDPAESPSPLAQFGTERNWKTVVRDPSFGRSVLLLKRDGTLWRWRNTNQGPARVSFFAAAPPSRLGTHSDWASIVSTGPRVYLTKTNGTVWGLNLPRRPSSKSLEPLGGGPIDVGLYLQPCENMDLSEWQSLAGHSDHELGVKVSGTLWAIGLPDWARWSRHQEEFQLDPASDWKAVAANFNKGLALKNDGSLWTIDYGTWNQPPAISRLSRQTDWLAVTSLHDTLFALAADGSLWAWTTYPYRPPWTELVGPIEIAPPRIPTRIGSLIGPR